MNILIYRRKALGHTLREGDPNGGVYSGPMSPGWNGAGATGGDYSGPSFTPSGGYAAPAKAPDYNANASFPSAEVPAQQMAALAAASALGYGTDPAERSLWSRFGIIPGMTSDAYMDREAQVPGARDDRMDTINQYVLTPLVNTIKAATPLGTMERGVGALTALANGDGRGALNNFAGGLLGNYAGAAAAKASGLAALSPLVSAVVKGGITGGAVGAENGLAGAVGNTAAASVNSYTASTLAHALGITPAQASGLMGLAGTSQAIGNMIKGVLSQATRR